MRIGRQLTIIIISWLFMHGDKWSEAMEVLRSFV